MAFFQPTVSQRAEVPLLARCGACGLFEGCLSPKMPVSGEGRLGVLVVGEAPGQNEDEKGEQLIGPAGQELRSVLRSLDVDLDRDCWKTNSIICRPPNNRTPTPKEIDYCRPNLYRAISELKPRVIIPLGAVAVRSVIGPLWKEDTGGVTTWAGFRIPCQKFKTWIAPTFHPSHVIRSKEDREGPVVKLWFEEHLRQAFQLGDVPNYLDIKDQVRVVIDPVEAAEWLYEKMKTGEAIAFDYETNMLKPDADNAEIVSCGVCWAGRETIAYPWVGDAVVATKAILELECPKIGANTKFESRWSKRFGIEVRNWVWDCMLSAHHLDCRAGITSVKFQAFVRLGLEDWSDASKTSLKDVKTDGTNRIKEIRLRDLLFYNGMDAVVEYKVAELQRQEMKGQ